ncbi:MAG: hypothetical protein LHV68_09700 [Elusimicrobia bacterium]|nr:hypothetical protein [Candidatus Liberimonas magnetica]
MKKAYLKAITEKMLAKAKLEDPALGVDRKPNGLADAELEKLLGQALFEEKKRGGVPIAGHITKEAFEAQYLQDGMNAGQVYLALRVEMSKLWENGKGSSEAISAMIDLIPYFGEARFTKMTEKEPAVLDVKSIAKLLGAA